MWRGLVTEVQGRLLSRLRLKYRVNRSCRCQPQLPVRWAIGAIDFKVCSASSSVTAQYIPPTAPAAACTAVDGSGKIPVHGDTIMKYPAGRESCAGVVSHLYMYRRNRIVHVGFVLLNKNSPVFKKNQNPSVITILNKLFLFLNSQFFISTFSYTLTDTCV